MNYIRPTFDQIKKIFDGRNPKSLSDIGAVIHESMLLFTKINPTNSSIEVLIDFAVGMAMRFTGGKGRCSTFKDMALMNDAGFEGFNGSRMC